MLEGRGSLQQVDLESDFVASREAIFLVVHHMKLALQYADGVLPSDRSAMVESVLNELGALRPDGSIAAAAQTFAEAIVDEAASLDEFA